MTDKTSDADLLKLCEAATQNYVVGRSAHNSRDPRRWLMYVDEQEPDDIPFADFHNLADFELFAAAREAIPRLLDEISTWQSVFPDIAPDEVQRDRSLVEAENERLRAALQEIADRDDERYAAGGHIARAALEHGGE